MKRILIGVLLSGLLCGVAMAQDIGRVILSVGDVNLVREGRSSPLGLGVGIRSGDRIITGGASNAQIRFTDTGIVALRPDTDFGVEEYNFRGLQDGNERALFSLLKGGMRTITGLVGKLNQRNYRVRTATATIGIRGTHFNLVQCNENCKNADGSTAPDGTYGGVSDGRVGVTPLNATRPGSVANIDLAAAAAGRQFASAAGRVDAPFEETQQQPVLTDNVQLAQLGPPSGGGGLSERVFGSGEFFRVPDANTPAVQLLAPPSFLTDKLEGQLRASQRQTGAPAAAATGTAAASTASTSSASSTTVDARATTAPPVTEPLKFVSTETKTSGGSSSVLVTGVTGFVAAYHTGTAFEIIEDCTGSHCASFTATSFSVSNNRLVSYSTTAGFPKASLGSASVVDTGVATIAGAQYGWGRWTGNFSVVASNGQTYTNLPSGVLFGFTNDPTVGTGQSHSLPSSGTVSYVLVGGPNPVDTAGNAGSITSMSGTVNFTTRSLSMNMGLSLTVPSQGAASMSLSGSGVIPATTDSLSAANMSGSCSGSGCASASVAGKFDARFGGTAAQALVLNGDVLNAVKDTTLGSSTPRSVLFLNVLKCSTC